MNVTDAEIMTRMVVGEHMMHPAWLAVYGLLQDADRWEARHMGLPSGYRDWQIYMAMAVEGYADDIIVYDDEMGRQCFVFPPVVIPVDEDDGEGRA